MRSSTARVPGEAIGGEPVLHPQADRRRLGGGGLEEAVEDLRGPGVIRRSTS